MNQDEREDSTIYKVVVNHGEQYSIWPADRENPLGWRDAGKTGLKSHTSQPDNVSDKCGDSNLPLKRNDSCRFTESSRICSESDGTCCDQPIIGHCEPAPSLFGIRQRVPDESIRQPPTVAASV